MSDVKYGNFKGGKAALTREGNTIRKSLTNGVATYEYPTVRRAKEAMEHARITGNLLPGYK